MRRNIVRAILVGMAAFLLIGTSLAAVHITVHAERQPTRGA